MQQRAYELFVRFEYFASDCVAGCKIGDTPIAEGRDQGLSCVAHFGHLVFDQIPSSCSAGGNAASGKRVFDPRVLVEVNAFEGNLGVAGRDGARRGHVDDL